MLSMLRAWHTRQNVDEYAFCVQVRNAAGFAATRTFDAVSLSLWPSRGFLLHAYEVKCSRNDWLRELKDPSKAEAAAVLVDRFTVVVSDPAIVVDGELPPAWGLMAATAADKLRTIKAATDLPGVDHRRPVSREFLVCLLRAGGAIPRTTTAELVAEYQRGLAEGEARNAGRAKEREESLRTLQQRIYDFERASGIGLGGWTGARDKSPAEIGALVRSVLEGEKRAAQAQDQVRAVRQQLLNAAAGLERYL